MNNVQIIGRLTKDPDIRYTAGANQTAVARFSVAIDRPKKSDGSDGGADFPNVVCFGKTAELVDKYLGKGRLVGISGRLQTGSYEDKDGKKVYTTDVVADRVEFLDKSGDAKPAAEHKEVASNSDIPSGFSKLHDDIPF